jgi:hypothetical protein
VIDRGLCGEVKAGEIAHHREVGQLERHLDAPRVLPVNAARKLPRTAEVKFPSLAGQGARWA